jgi:probable F420-dependent oxidoreductase
MKFWQAIAFTEPEHLIDVARIAEEVGFDGLFVSEHLFHPQTLVSRYPYSPDGRPMFGPATPWPEPWSVIGAMAAVTTRLQFVTGVYILPLRHPIEVAKAVATVAVLSGNRVMLGVGAGWMREEFEVLGVDFASRGRRLDEMIEVLRTLWAGGMVEHHGKIFDFPPLQMAPVPERPVPIAIGGTTPAALRRAARLGDGWIGPGNDPADVPPLLQRLQALRREYGRERQPFETIVPLKTPPDVDQFRRLEDEGVSSFLNYPFLYTVGPTSSLDQKRRVLEQYGNEIIARARR